ncbi:hypothetical protein DL95DRAFT_384430 [Leptodontidium sp. 2 PMI_412]|nr:hypothetical protein DL95DRAFT_384430 [Leptodontidium sp. 2 PMI_412]
MGIILFQLTYNYHPWKFSINQCRDGKDNKQLRASFRKSNERAIDKMAKDYESARASPAKGFLHREYLKVSDGKIVDLRPRRNRRSCY